ncbi:hypothetical protein vseg_015126 [Gypsophila vaccaria]
MIGRLVSWIFEQRDTLWVRWVTINHLKGQEWREYQPGTNTSWVWRKICVVKELLITGFEEGPWTEQKYTPAAGYQWLSETGLQVPWSEVVWNNWVQPKHQMMGWLYAHKALRTKDRLRQLGMDIDATCLLCGQEPETDDHLFLQCRYSRLVLQALQTRLKIRLPLQGILEWCISFQGPQELQGCVAEIGLSIIYHIWRQRNKARHELCVISPKSIGESIVQELHYNTHRKIDNKHMYSDRDWLARLVLV